MRRILRVSRNEVLILLYAIQQGGYKSFRLADKL